MASAVTSIQIDVMTREKLRQFTKNGETYDEVICRLIDIARKASA
jgi:pyruvate-formate lyase